MIKMNEVSEALDNVIAKGEDFLGKAKRLYERVSSFV